MTRLVVADIAPVAYPSHFGGFARAMLRVPSSATRAEADALLAADVPDPAVRGFLLHNFRPGAGMADRAGGDRRRPAAGRDVGRADARYAGPALFVTGARSDYVLPEHRPAIMRLFPAARFVAIADAGHWLHAEQPVPFNAAVVDFLAAA